MKKKKKYSPSPFDPFRLNRCLLKLCFFSSSDDYYYYIVVLLLLSMVSLSLSSVCYGFLVASRFVI